LRFSPKFCILVSTVLGGGEESRSQIAAVLSECVRRRRLRLRSTQSSSRLTMLSVAERDSGVYTCRHRLDTDQLTIVVMTGPPAQQTAHNGTLQSITSCTALYPDAKMFRGKMNTAATENKASRA